MVSCCSCAMSPACSPGQELGPLTSEVHRPGADAAGSHAQSGAAAVRAPRGGQVRVESQQPLSG
jgi:hypothetical protein|eukprot:COSAG01_NODE_6671_length_3553_cov_23.353214_5_plen_64_part_00